MWCIYLFWKLIVFFLDRTFLIHHFTIVSIACLAGHRSMRETSMKFRKKGEETDKTSEPVALLITITKKLFPILRYKDAETNHLCGLGLKMGLVRRVGWHGKHLCKMNSKMVQNHRLKKEQCYKVTYNNVFKKQLECGLWYIKLRNIWIYRFLGSSLRHQPMIVIQ